MKVRKTIGKIVAVFFLVAMLFCIAGFAMPQTAKADGTSTINVEEKRTTPGKDISVEIQLSNSPNVAVLFFDLKYDDSVLTLNSITYGEEFSTGGEQPQTYHSPVRISWSDLTEKSGTLPFAVLHFSVTNSINAEYNAKIEIVETSLDAINIDEQEVEYTIVNGGITIMMGVPGDITGDGKVNAMDLLRLRKHFAGWEVEVDEIALDVTGDGKVNAMDLLRLRKYFAGWEVEIFYGSISNLQCSHIMEKVQAKEPTCTENGNSAYYKCTRCGKYFADEEGAQEIAYESTVIAKLEHTEESLPAKEATCTKSGLTEGKKCSVCQTVLVKQTVVPALGHSYEEIERKEKTCTEDGYIRLRCSVCEEEKTQILLATGHVFGYDNVCDVCGYELLIHAHEYESEKVDPTCTSMGYTIYTCASCGNSYKSDYIDALGHRWDEGEITVEPTCTQVGTIVYSCVRCDATYSKEVAISHIWKEERVEPTCFEDGYVVRTCENCGEVEREVLSAAHTWEEVEIIKEANCEEEGKISVRCAVCGEEEEQTIPAKGHVFVNGVCTVCGKEFIEIVTPEDEHPEYGMFFLLDPITSNYGPETINEYGVLLYVNEGAVLDRVAVYLTQDNTMWRRCIAFTGENIEFAYYVPYLSYGTEILYTGLNSPYINTFELKKGADGIWRYSEYATIGVNLEDNQGNLLLSLYQIGQAGAKTRIFDNLSEMKAWLMGEDGVHTHTIVVDEEIPATCTKNGLSAGSHCSVCGEVILSRTIILAHHTLSLHAATFASCTVNGNTAYYSCSACGKFFADSEGKTEIEKDSWIIPSPGHSSGSTVIENEVKPTCTEDGSYDEVVYCTVCNEQISRTHKTVSKLDHNYVYTVKTQPTCTTSGKAVYRCTRCNEETGNIYIPVRGHSYVSTVTQELTCTQDGIIKYTCTVCDNSYQVVTKAEHTYKISAQVAPTCTEEGYTEYTCSVCKATYRDVIPGGHNYVAEITKQATAKEDGVITYTCSKCGDSYEVGIPALGEKEQVEGSVLLIQDNLPWQDNTNVTLLNRLKEEEIVTSWNITTATAASSVDFSEYSLVYIANDQTTATYNKLNALSTALADYVSNGGILVYGACDHGWSSGDISFSLVGGVTKQENHYSVYNYIVNDSHPIITAEMTDGKNLTNELLRGTYCSHTSFKADTLPEGATILLEDGHGNPTLVEYPYGEGTVIASGLTWEFYYVRLYSDMTNNYSKSVFDDMLVYALSLANTCEHEYEEVETVAPTCTEKGYTKYVCTICEKVHKAEFVDALGHTWNAGEVTKEATCTQEGEILFTCTVCSETRTEVVEKLPHTLTKTSAVEATCTVNGNGEYYFCSVCEKYFADSEGKTEIEKDSWIILASHSLTKTAAVAATCTAGGNSEYYFCSACGKYFSDEEGTNEISLKDTVIPAFGHNYVNGVCTICGESDPDYVSPTYSEGLKYTLSYDKTYYSVSGIGTCTDTEVVIPSEYNGLPVTSIKSSAFSGCSSLTSITIPDSVTSIGKFAFSGCSSLTSITILEGVKSIGDSAFNGCSGLKEIMIPRSVTGIGNWAFAYCNNLTSITIPDSVTSIGEYAFANCSSLMSITIPDSVTSIGGWAFWNCNRLESITIPDGVTSIANSAFQNCSSLTSITIPDGVTSIGDCAFSGCSSLTSITIPDSVTSIGDGAFHGCSSLTSTTIPDSVTSIGEGAFEGCERLTEITIPEGVTSIGDGAFNGCSALTSITIPESVTSIGDWAFGWCRNLANITIPDSVTSIGSYAFLGCSSLTSITIPDSVTRIGNSAFSGCSSLTSITIPDSVTNIENDAFEGCSGLTKVIIPEGVTSIGWSAFADCSSLTSIIIPDSVTSIGGGAFRECSSLTSIAIPEGVTSIESDVFRNCSSLTSIAIPEGVTRIGNQAFYGCGSLTSITIPDSVTSMGDWAFGWCRNLANITIPDSVTSIGSSAFRECSSLTTVNYTGSEEDWSKISIGSFNIPLNYATIIFNYHPAPANPEEGHTHTLTKTAAVAATCTAGGNSEYYFCSVCEKYFADDLAQTEISENSWLTDALDHELTKTAAVEATATSAGNSEYYTCSRCNKYFSDAQGNTEIAKDSWIIPATGNTAAYTIEGNYLYFGSYPQTEVTAASTKSALDSLAGTLPTSSNSGNWTSYGYYIAGSVSNFMWYIDRTYGGDNYRGVYFTSYRPRNTTDSSSASNSYQDDNGYSTGMVYWFKYEPLKWRILTNSNGEAFVVSDGIIDSQQYYRSLSSRTINGSTVYANNYQYSDIRAWLNETFYQTAFSAAEQALIKTTSVDNSAASTRDSQNKLKQATSYACANTQDKIFLLSEKEVTTLYNSAVGFSTTYDAEDTRRQLKNTDYAKSQGAFTSTSYAGNGNWWLRSPTYSSSSYARNVYNFGCASYINDVYNTGYGVVPALKIRLTAEEHTHSLTKTAAVAATCTDNGNSEYYSCSACGKYFSDEEGTNEISLKDTVIYAMGHLLNEWKVAVGDDYKWVRHCERKDANGNYLDGYIEYSNMNNPNA